MQLWKQNKIDHSPVLWKQWWRWSQAVEKVLDLLFFSRSLLLKSFEIASNLFESSIWVVMLILSFLSTRKTDKGDDIDGSAVLVTCWWLLGPHIAFFHYQLSTLGCWLGSEYFQKSHLPQETRRGASFSWLPHLRTSRLPSLGPSLFDAAYVVSEAGGLRAATHWPLAIFDLKINKYIF